MGYRERERRGGVGSSGNFALRQDGDFRQKLDKRRREGAGEGWGLLKNCFQIRGGRVKFRRGTAALPCGSQVGVGDIKLI